MPYWSGIRKRYTTLLCRRTSSGPSALRQTVFTLGAFGRGALEPFGKSFNLCCESKLPTTNIWPHQCARSKASWIANPTQPCLVILTISSHWHPTTYCCSNQKLLFPLAYSRKKIRFHVVDEDKYNILLIFSGADGARNTFLFCSLGRSGWNLREIRQLAMLFWFRLTLRIAIPGR